MDMPALRWKNDDLNAGSRNRLAWMVFFVPRMITVNYDALCI